MTQIEREIRELSRKVDEVHSILAGPKSGKKYVSGAQAARLLGISYYKFQKDFVQRGNIGTERNGKYDVRRVKALVNSSEVVER